MPLLTDDELKAFPEPTTADVVPHHVARYWDLMALSDHQPARVIGADAKLRDRPGFDVELLSRNSIPATPYSTPKHEVLMPMRGHWRLTWDQGSTIPQPRRHLRHSARSVAFARPRDDRRGEPVPRHGHG